MSRVSICMILLLFSVKTGYTAEVFISIFNEYNLAALVISPGKGDYTITGDGLELYSAEENEILYVSLTGEELVLRCHAGILGSFREISINQYENNGWYSLMPVDPLHERRYYHGSLHLSIEFGRIKAVNIVPEDLYIAGVVEAESGLGWNDMYYRAQSIICRTYLYENLARHADEGFHLCDGVHCQVYKGQLTSDQVIEKAVNYAGGMVITGADSAIITAAFHSNCGGQTVNSEEVWLVHRPYLRSVNDPFCLGGRSYSWERRIDTHDWGRYLSEMGMGGSEDKTDPYIFRFSQDYREIHYSTGGFRMPLRKIRNDWNLRSAFFDVEVPDRCNVILLRGRGHGHGVGLCQEGAIEMAAKGYNFIDILQFYYTDIIITDISDLCQKSMNVNGPENISKHFILNDAGGWFKQVNEQKMR